VPKKVDCLKYYRVTLPVLQVVPTRHAQAGQLLDRSVFTPDGRVLAEGNTKLTPELLKKFKNFKVRQLVIQGTQEHWLPEAEVKKLGSKAEVIEEEEFSEAAEDIITTIRETNSIRKMRKVADFLHSQALEQNNQTMAGKTEETVRRSYNLEEKIETLTDQLETVTDPEARDEIMDALEGTISELEETFMEISAPEKILAGTVQVVNEREEIRTSITDIVNDNPNLMEEFTESHEELDASEIQQDHKQVVEKLNKGHILSAINKLQETTENADVRQELQFLRKQLKVESEKSEELKKELHNQELELSERKTLLDALGGQSTISRKRLEALPISEDFARKTYKFIENREDLRVRLWDVSNAATDDEFEQKLDKNLFIAAATKTPKKPDFIGSRTDSGEAENAIGENELKDVISDFENHNAENAISKLIDKTKESSDYGAQMVGKLNLTKKSISELESEGKKLAKKIDNEVDSDAEIENLLRMLENEKKIVEEDLQETNVSNKLKTEITQFSSKRERQQKRLWQAVDELSGGAVRKLEGAQEKMGRGTRKAAGGQRIKKKIKTETEVENKSISKNKLSLEKALQERDPYDLSNISGLDFQTVKEALHVLAKPTGLKKQQQTLFKNIRRLCEFVLYGKKLDEDRLTNLIASSEEILTGNSQPIKLLSQPPSGDRYILTHSMNTFLVSLMLGIHFELSEQEMMDLGAASICSDLGMTEIPLALWALQDGKMSGRGEGEIKKHPLISHEFVTQATNNDSHLKDLVLQHHEKRDGSGYPHGIPGEEQHPLTPLISIADSYTAMLEKRSHRSSIAPDKAMLSLLKNNRQFERSTVKSLLDVLGFYPSGCVVLLSNNCIAAVQTQNSNKPLAPKVVEITDSNQNRLDQPRVRDLTSQNNLKVKRILKF
jgi:HD-GYP domain-containing protein (c-di-GMP phosphodiesterase class II)